MKTYVECFKYAYPSISTCAPEATQGSDCLLGTFIWKNLGVHIYQNLLQLYVILITQFCASKAYPMRSILALCFNFNVLLNCFFLTLKQLKQGRLLNTFPILLI